MIQRLSNNECKQLASLKVKKYRTEQQLFLVEGEKLVEEAWVSGIPIKTVIGVEEWWQNRNKLFDSVTRRVATVQQIKQLSMMITPPPVVAVVQIPSKSLYSENLIGKISIALENIQDPGNLGTIIRLADWLGIANVICSNGSVEAFNHKVIQSSMGSIFRVNVHYTDLIQLCQEAKTLKIPLLGTFLEGENIYTAELPTSGILVMGNESKGISDRLSKLVDRKITIPAGDLSEQHAESLNVAVATAIVCSEWLRKIRWC